jgi:hypothetical protein
VAEKKEIKTFADIIQNIRGARLTFDTREDERWIVKSGKCFNIYSHKPRRRNSTFLGEAETEKEAVKIATTGIEI